MDRTTAELQATLENARNQFRATVGQLRIKLHRFCARMCGSALDGEDVVQEALAHAFYNLYSLKDPSRLEPWLFRIAHHKCVDFIRRQRRQRADTERYEDERQPEGLAYDDALQGEPISEPLAALLIELPPMERAAVLLKDVLQYRSIEIAEIVDSTVGGVKAALHRGRAKLRTRSDATSPVQLDPAQRKLLEAYVECFNRQDWDAVRELIRADANLEVVDGTFGKLKDMDYFGKYAVLPWRWKLSLGHVDGEPVILHWKLDTDWRPLAAIRLWWQDGKVVRVRDYARIDYLLQHASTVADA